MTARATVDDTARIADKLARLERAIQAGSSRARCLRLWSEFDRERDGQRCVDCHSTQRLSAHHISRKSFIVDAQLLTGNGMTLCRSCHGEAHLGSNSRADMGLPVDAQGGEKLQGRERFYSILVDDAVDRGLEPDQFYFLCDRYLATLKKMQGYDPSTYFPGRGSSKPT